MKRVTVMAMTKDTKSEKTIMFIIASLAGGGAERVTANLCNSLCDRYQICVVTLFEHPDAYSLDDRVTRFDFSRDEASLSKIRRKLRRVAGYMPRLMWLSSIKKQCRPDVTISMLELSNVLNVMCGNEYKILSERADPQQIGGEYYRAARFSLKRANHVVFQSRRVQRMFSERVQKKSSIILNPVRVSRQASERTTKKIVTAGRLSEQKNHRMMINAFDIFRSTHPDYVLEIYGQGELRDVLEQQIEELGLNSCVVIRDFAQDLHAQIADAEMFVLSSDYEGLSNALLEAMMMGIPCVSTDCAGSDEIIEDGVNGLLAPVGDEEALAEAMNLMADYPELRKNISQAGKVTSKRFDNGVVIRQWIELIEKSKG